MDKYARKVRPAKVTDCAAIAQLYSISSDGVADYVWTQIAEPGENILAIGQQRYERTDTDFSYENCHVVEQDNQVIGLLSSFAIHIDPDYVEDDPILAPFMILEEDDSYYICGVSLFEQYRGQGIGSDLMALAENLAKEKGFSKTSLVVFEDNAGAKKLYERLGYKEVKRSTITPHPLIHFEGDAILMVKHLNSSPIPQ